MGEQNSNSRLTQSATPLPSCGKAIARKQMALAADYHEAPILADMVSSGKLKVVGAYYDLPTGKVVMV